MIKSKCGGGYITAIPLSDIEYIGYFYGLNGNESVSSAYIRLKTLKKRAPDFLFNAELFDFNTRKAASDVVSGGTIHRLKEGFGIAFPNNTTAVFSYKNNVGAKDYIGAYPVLVRNSKVESAVPDGIGGERGRTAIGVNKDTLFVALVPDGTNDVSLATLRKSFISVGATDAINLDGGGSTQFYSPSKTFLSNRNVRGFIGIWLKNQSTPSDIRTVNVKWWSCLRIREKPNTSSKVVGKLYRGSKVTVLETSGNWCRIQNGWVSSDYLIK